MWEGSHIFIISLPQRFVLSYFCAMLLALSSAPVAPAFQPSDAMPNRPLSPARLHQRRTTGVVWNHASGSDEFNASLVAGVAHQDDDRTVREVTETHWLAALCAALVTLSTVAVLTRGDGATAPPFQVGREMLAGGLAAAAAEVIFFPLEVAKVRLQARRQGQQSVQLSLPAELTAVLRTGAWYARPGVVAGVVRALVYHGIRLGLFPAVNRALAALLAAAHGGESRGIALVAKVLNGAICGALGAVMCNPLDLVKARMAASPDEHANSLRALASIANNEGGARGLWRGAPATTVRAELGSGAQLATYAAVKPAVARHVVPLLGLPKGSGLPVLAATVAAAAAYVTAAAPADLVKTRLMLSRKTTTKGGAPHYAGLIDCFRSSIQAEGPSVLFRGWGASYARLLPVLLLVFPLLEWLRVAFGVGTF